MFTQDYKHNWKFKILFYICHTSSKKENEKRAATQLKESGLKVAWTLFVVQHLHRNPITTFIYIRPSDFTKDIFLTIIYWYR